MPTKLMVVWVLLSYHVIVGQSSESGEGEEKDAETLVEQGYSGDRASGVGEQGQSMQDLKRDVETGTSPLVKAPLRASDENLKRSLVGEKRAFPGDVSNGDGHTIGGRLATNAGSIDHVSEAGEKVLEAYLIDDTSRNKDKRTIIPSHQYGGGKVNQESGHQVRRQKSNIPIDDEAATKRRFVAPDANIARNSAENGEQSWASKLNKVVKKDSLQKAPSFFRSFHDSVDDGNNIAKPRSTIQRAFTSQSNITRHHAGKKRSDTLESASKDLTQPKTPQGRDKFFLSYQVAAKKRNTSSRSPASSKTSHNPRFIWNSTSGGDIEDPLLKSPPFSAVFNPSSLLTEIVGEAASIAKSYRPAIVPTDDNGQAVSNMSKAQGLKKRKNLQDLLSFLPKEESPFKNLQDGSELLDSEKYGKNPSAGEFQDASVINDVLESSPKYGQEDKDKEGIGSWSKPSFSNSPSVPDKAGPAAGGEPMKVQETIPLSSPKQVSGFQPVAYPSADAKPVANASGPKVGDLWNQPPPVASSHFEDVVNPSRQMMEALQRENVAVEEELEHLQTRLVTLERTVSDISDDVGKIEARVGEIEESRDSSKLAALPQHEVSESTTPPFLPLSALQQSTKFRHPLGKSFFVKLPPPNSLAAMSIEKGNPVPLLPFPFNMIVSEIFRKMLQAEHEKKASEHQFHPLHPLPDGSYPPLEHDINRLEMELGRIPHATVAPGSDTALSSISNYAPQSTLALAVADIPAATTNIATEDDKDDEPAPEEPPMRTILEKPEDARACVRTCLNGGRCRLDGDCQCPYMFMGSRCQHFRSNSNSILNVFNELRAQELDDNGEKEKQNFLSVPFALVADDSAEKDATKLRSMAQVEQGKLVNILSQIAGSSAFFPQARK